MSNANLRFQDKTRVRANRLANFIERQLSADSLSHHCRRRKLGYEVTLLNRRHIVLINSPDILNPNLERYVGRPTIGITHILGGKYGVWKNGEVEDDFLLGMESELDHRFHENLVCSIIDMEHIWVMFPVLRYVHLTLKKLCFNLISCLNLQKGKRRVA